MASNAIIEHFTWADAKREALHHLTRSGEHTCKQHAMLRQADRWHTESSRDFTGSNAEEMVEYLTNGYKPALAALSQVSFEAREERRIIFAEEGELDLPLAYSGFDYPYLDWETPESLPGLRIRAETGASAFVPAETISAYGAWLAGLVSALETRGYDLDVALVNLARRLDLSRPYTPVGWHLTVKRENELSSFRNWSALFAPGGYRTIGWLLKGMTCDRIGGMLSSGFGEPMQNRWSVEFDRETLTLTIGIDAQDNNFPREYMDRRLAELGILN